MRVNEWATWENPSVDWVKQNAEVPGLKWQVAIGDGFRPARVSSVTYHSSHLPLLPPLHLAAHDLLIGLPIRTMLLDAFDDVERATTNASHRGVVLRDYQRDALPYILSRRASILGYEMRLGKTCTATAAHIPSDGPLVILAPLIARDVWQTWCERLHGFAPVALESRNDVALPGFPAYFCHFDVLDAHTKFFNTLPSIATLIIDEIHLLQARRSQRISAASLLAAKADRIIGLSGTPMWTNPRTLWPILNLLAPGAWGTEFEFCKRYTNATQSAYGWTYNGVRNEDELRLRLNEMILRLTWKDVVKELPPTTNVVELVQLTNTDKQRSESLAQKAQLAAVGAGVQASTVGYLATLRRLFGMAKVGRAVDLAKRAIDDGHKVVLWSWHNDVADALVCELGGRCILHQFLRAQDSQRAREIYLKNFQESAHPLALVSALNVGGVAIDLSCADVNIFVEMDWIPATMYQAAMRTFLPNRPSANVWMVADVPIERRLVDVLGCNEACQSAVGLGYEEITARITEVLGHGI